MVIFYLLNKKQFMVTEKETIAKILRVRGILQKDGTVDMVRFQKLVTEPWIHQKAKQYGFLDVDTVANKIVVEVPVAPEVAETEPVEEAAPVAETEPVEEAVEETPVKKSTKKSKK